jgi:hypothetical protein
MWQRSLYRAPVSSMAAARRCSSLAQAWLSSHPSLQQRMALVHRAALRRPAVSAQRHSPGSVHRAGLDQSLVSVRPQHPALARHPGLGRSLVSVRPQHPALERHPEPAPVLVSALRSSQALERVLVLARQRLLALRSSRRLVSPMGPGRRLVSAPGPLPVSVPPMAQPQPWRLVRRHSLLLVPRLALPQSLARALRPAMPRAQAKPPARLPLRQLAQRSLRGWGRLPAQQQPERLVRRHSPGWGLRQAHRPQRGLALLQPMGLGPASPLARRRPVVLVHQSMRRQDLRSLRLSPPVLAPGRSRHQELPQGLARQQALALPSPPRWGWQSGPLARWDHLSRVETSRSGLVVSA